MSDSSTFELELFTMAHGGHALGRHDNRTIFVPYTIPGEVVEARVVEDRGRVAFAQGVRLVDASADRVYPRCPHFGPGRCGRCQWQHIDQQVQPLIKQDVLADQLARIGGFDNADVQPIIPSPVAWGYNYHMTMQVDDQGKTGFARSLGEGVASIEECHIIHPDLLELYQNLDLEFTNLHRLKLQLSTDGAQMIILYVDSEEDAPELSTDIPASVNLLLPDNEPVNLIGDSHSRYTIGERTFRVTAGSEFRANIAQIDPLAKLVSQHLLLDTSKTVLDLYGGVGVFSAYFAPHVDLVTFVESYPPAATDAEENLSDFENVDVYEGTVEDVLASLEEFYDAAVLDPPSDGVSVEVIDLLDENRIPRLVYVSSDPATLARDAKRLVNKGYTLREVFPIDLHPQTYYIDSVAVFQR
jgi:23S rRNA (uracil1939-C5)-methyltransferase